MLKTQHHFFTKMLEGALKFDRARWNPRLGGKKYIFGE